MQNCNLWVRHGDVLLKVLLDDKDGIAAGLLQKAGADVSFVREQVAKDVEKLPKVNGNSVQVSASQAFVKALDLAEQYAEKANGNAKGRERLRRCNKRQL